MNRSILLAVVIGFGVIAIQVGSAAAKETKAPGKKPTSTSAVVKNIGNDKLNTKLFGQGQVTKLSPSLKNLSNDKFNTNLFGQGQVTKLPPSLKNLGNDRFNTNLFGTTPITWGGNPPRAPQQGCDHNGCDHDGCNHYCDWHHDCHHFCDWMYFGDTGYGSYYDNTCGDFDFCW